MNTDLLAAVVAKNSADVEAIIAKIGVIALLQLTPNFVAILKTIQEQQATAPK